MPMARVRSAQNRVIALRRSSARSKARGLPLVAGTIAAAGGRPQAVQADSADPAAVRQAVEQCAAKLDRLDILVSNAGIFRFGPPEDVSLEELDPLTRISQCAQTARVTSGGRFHPGSCRLIW